MKRGPPEELRQTELAYRFVNQTVSEANMKTMVSRLFFGVREPNILIKNRIFAYIDFVRNSAEKFDARMRKVLRAWRPPPSTHSVFV